MTNYKSLTFWQNKKRQSILNKYKKALREYFNLADFDHYQGTTVENEESLAKREWLNKHSDETRQAIFEAGCHPYIDHTDPPIIGGRTRRVDLIENVAHLHQFQIGPDVVIDTIDKSLGNYEQDLLNSVLRTINPFFWVGKLLDWIAGIPFRFLKELGVKDSDKLEESFLGRITKLTIKFCTGLPLMWEFLVFLGVFSKDDTLLGILQRFKIL